MKEVLRAAGVPTAKSTGASSAAEVRTFAAEVGYPLIVKPRSGAGASGTVQVKDAAELETAIAGAGFERGASVAVEEFIEGHEGFYDTLSVAGHIGHDFISHYYPNVLEAMRTRWISPQIVVTNRLDAPGYTALKVMGADVIRALGIGTSATHMEWFYGPRGLKFSEIGCRPPGVGAWDLYSAANEFDLFTGVGPRHRERPRLHAPLPPLRRRHDRAAPRPRRPHHRLRGRRAPPPPPRALDHRHAPAAPGHADAARRGRLHGERLGPHEAPRLRHAARHARLRRPDGPRRARGRPGRNAQSPCAP